jgi:NAD(P)-dependent dehydrogenase (short-subunit alcohol dehydrogenase family)
MRALVVGGTGMIGRRLVPLLQALGHDVVVAARNSGDVRVDLESHDSIEQMFRSVGPVDAVVAVAANGPLDEFDLLTVDDLQRNLRAKLFGQIDLVLTGRHHCADGASFILTSGIFADEAWPGVTGGAVISGGLHSFVLSASIELPRRMRINVISPTLVGETIEASDAHFPGMEPVLVDDLVEIYVDLVEGNMTGQIIRAYGSGHRASTHDARRRRH